VCGTFDRSVLKASLQSKTLRSALAFAIGLMLYEIAVLAPDGDRQSLFEYAEQGRPLAVVRSAFVSGFSLLLTAAFLSIALSARSVFKVIFFCLFSFATIVEYTHHAAFQRFSYYSTAAVAVHAGDWLFSAKALAMYFNPLCLPPILAFAILLAVHDRSRFKMQWTTSLIALIVSFCAFMAYASSNVYPAVSVWAFTRTAVGFPIIHLVGRAGRLAMGAPRERDRLGHVAAAKPLNNIVMIVDESVRADHLHINGYPSNQVAALSELSRRNYLANFGIASSGSTCSGPSNNLLFTGLKDLPDRELKIYRLPTIFQYARAMGYKTHEFDGQVSSVWKGREADLKYIQHRQTPVHFAGAVQHDYEIDGEIARRVREIVSNSAGNFIWVNKRGIHKPYTEAFPIKGRSILDSWFVGYDRRISTEQLVADYNSAISFNLNLFFGQLLENGNPAPNTIYVYTSDHGQSLREGGVLVSHCSTSSRTAAMVPLFIFGSDVRSLNLPTAYKASHANIFPTLLDLMKVPPKVKKSEYAVSLMKAKESEPVRRYYFARDLTGEDGGRGYPFDP
jgi:glucan phosphoethanolaminetransferase (alkaline phosphatase superfamily)